MKNQAAFIKSLPIVAKAIGRKYGVTVRIGGDQAWTTGKVIQLPALPAEATNEDLPVLMNGYLDHEAAHCRFTDFEAPRAKGNAFQNWLENALEDIRIETQMGLAYPGCHKNLDALATYLVERGVDKPLTEDVDDTNVLTAHILNGLRYKVLGQQALKADAELAERLMAERYPASMVSRLDPLLDEVRGATSTSDAIDLADRVMVLLREEVKPPEQPQPNDSGDSDDSDDSGEPDQSDDSGGSEGSDDSNESDETDGQNESADDSGEADDPGDDFDDTDDVENGPDGSDDSDGSNESGGSDEQGGSSNSEEADETDDGDESADYGTSGASNEEAGDSDQAEGNSNGGNDADGSNESDGSKDQGNTQGSNGSGDEAADDEAKRQAIADTLAASSDDLPEDRADQLREALESASESDESVEMAQPSDGAGGDSCSCPAGSLPIDEERARQTSARLRARLAGLMQAQSMELMSRRRSGRHIDRRALPGLAYGDPRIFQGHVESETVDTAVTILLDRSYSMMQKARIVAACETALAMAWVLEEVPGVNASAFAFPGVGGCDNSVLTLHRRGRKVDAKRFGVKPNGSTPLTEAVWFAGWDLLCAPEPRKILLVVTDGSPDSPRSASDVMARLRASGVETLGVGIQQAIAPGLIPESVTVQQVTDLPNQLFGLLESALLKPAA